MNRIVVCGALIGVAVMLAPESNAQGQRPQLPLSYGHVQKLGGDRTAQERLGAHLPAVETRTSPRNVQKPISEAAAAAAVAPAAVPAGSGSWSNLRNGPPGGPYNFGNPLLLTDGTVIAHRTDTPDWYRLMPSITGSYLDGTWTKIASMQPSYGPKFFASAVLPDGRVIAMGGEYNLGQDADWGTQGAIYDPLAGPGGAWRPVQPPTGWSTIGDGQSTVLANGTFMLASCCDFPPKAALFNPLDLSWTPTGTNKADRYDEESWTLLPDGSVLTVDTYTTPVGNDSCGRNTERYNPTTGAWSPAGEVPAQLSDCNNQNTAGGSSPSYEIGPSVLMYNGKVIAFGGTTANVARTALYDLATGRWSAGPDLPTSCGPTRNQPCTLADAPATLLSNGNVLFVASAGKFGTPASFFEYDPIANAIRPVAGTSDAGDITSFYVNFLTLPTGQTLAVETYTSTIQIYTSPGTPQEAWRPVVSSAPSCVVRSNSYAVAGRQLNGLTQSANYGDDQQAATNYPLVRIVNNATGHVFYARTANHSTMTLAPNAPGSTTFTVAAGTETGPSTLYVVANGIPSQGLPVTVEAAGCLQ